MTNSISRELYRRVLLLYPEPFRHEFGDEILGMFEECKAAQGCLRVLADVVLSAVKQQVRYLSTPVPKSTPLYSEIAWCPSLARILAAAVFGAALIAGVWAGGRKPKAPESWTELRAERRFWFPAVTPWPYCYNAAEAVRGAIGDRSAGWHPAPQSRN